MDEKMIEKLKSQKTYRREPLTDTQLLMTITICIFMAMYVLAMVFLKGGFLHPQQVFDMLNDNASLRYRHQRWCSDFSCGHELRHVPQ